MDREDAALVEAMIAVGTEKPRRPEPPAREALAFGGMVATLIGAAALMLALLVGCVGDDSYGPACTLIGCEDGISIEIAGALPPAYTITVEAPGAAPRVFECTAAAPCMRPLFVGGSSPATVRVSVEGEGVDVTRDFTPQYTVSRPNGPECPPECRQATVVVDLE